MAPKPRWRIECPKCGRTWNPHGATSTPRCPKCRNGVLSNLRWVLALLLLSGAGLLLWTNRDVVRKFASDASEKAPPDDPAPPPKDPPKSGGDPSKERKKELAKSDPETREPEVAEAPYSEAEMVAAFRKVDSHVAEARYREAREVVAALQERRISLETHRTRHRDWRERTQAYVGLIRETQPGGTIRMPEMTRLSLANGNWIVARTLRVDGSHFSFEDIRGIRSRIPKSEVNEAKRLEPNVAFWEVWGELKRICGYKGVEAAESHAGDAYVFRFRELPNRKVTGLQFFDLADFCAANGANELLTPLFDEALRRDKDLVATVHEIKGERMIDVLFYFLSLRSNADADYTLNQVVIPHYSDTRAYRERLSKDVEARDIVASILKREVPVAAAEPKKTEEPPPTRTDPPRSGPPEDDVTRAAMPADTPANVKGLVEDGDRRYRAATEHLLNSDPNRNPDGWAAENKKALEEFRQAARQYEAAQELYAKGADVPRALLDRFREAQMRMSLCRKRSVSSR